MHAARCDWADGEPAFAIMLAADNTPAAVALRRDDELFGDGGSPPSGRVRRANHRMRQRRTDRGGFRPETKLRCITFVLRTSLRATKYPATQSGRGGIYWPNSIPTRRPPARVSAKFRKNQTGGERGIRTLDALLEHARFPGVCLQPLGHLSAEKITVAERVMLFNSNSAHLDA